MLGDVWKTSIFFKVNVFKENIDICDCAHKNQEPIQNQNFLLPTKNYCLTFPLSPLQISEQKNHQLRSNCHLKEYIAPELLLLLMTSLFTFYVVYFPLSTFAVYIIVFLPVVPFTYIIHT